MCYRKLTDSHHFIWQAKETQRTEMDRERERSSSKYNILWFHSGGLQYHIMRTYGKSSTVAMVPPKILFCAVCKMFSHSKMLKGTDFCGSYSDRFQTHFTAYTRRHFKFVNLFPAELFSIELFTIVERVKKTACNKVTCLDGNSESVRLSVFYIILVRSLVLSIRQTVELIARGTRKKQFTEINGNPPNQHIPLTIL